MKDRILSHIHTAMHNTFQRDLYRLRLETARSYVKAVTASLTPVTSTQDGSLKISAQVGSYVCVVGGMFMLIQDQVEK